jgi:vitamin-K-epoxide reductase (warfarin-sensitive)
LQGTLESASVAGIAGFVARKNVFEMSIDINKGIHVMCFFGMGLSYYAYVVETTKEHDEDYVAMCDFSEHMSCSKAFMSP